MISAIVIDDENDVLEVFCEYLKVKNVNVLAKGRNGKDAIELYQKLKPDVVRRKNKKKGGEKVK